MLRGALQQKLTDGAEGKIDAREKIFTIIYCSSVSFGCRKTCVDTE